MNRTARIATWVASAAIVAGLVAIASPAIGGMLASSPSPTRASGSSEKPTPVTTTPAEVRVSPTPTPTPVAAPEDPCPSPRPSISLVQDGRRTGYYNEGGGTVTGVLDGELTDLGPREFAKGTVKRNAAGEIVSYTVAPGDVYDLIYERFCFTDYYSVISYNNGLEPLRSRPAYRGLQPGDVLILRPDPAVRWRPPAY
ncbi:hypothetical protein ACFVAE_10930 [Microbacterium sp. NPDC057659]|uniref:hypothetical protein n=1 Tax=Microbacterium sp. NPDC057659 TaxID=3346198 RepID=UPI0036707B98